MKRERLDFLADNPLYTKRFAVFVGRRCRDSSIKDVAGELHLDWHTRAQGRVQMQGGGHGCGDAGAALRQRLELEHPPACSAWTACTCRVRSAGCASGG
ncbi:MAG: transposase family protein [Gammaproteobacteria bacterium]|nr:transposase family protein [Gammaproteobacteria bacterium]